MVRSVVEVGLLALLGYDSSFRVTERSQCLGTAEPGRKEEL